MSFQPSPISLSNPGYDGLFDFLKKDSTATDSSAESFSSQVKGLDFSSLSEEQQADVLGYQTAKQEKWSSIISTAGGLATTGLSIFGASRQAKTQQERETAMAQEQAKLLALQQQVAAAQGVSAQASAQAAAATQGAATTRTLLIAGGAVLVVGILAAAFVAAKRSGGDDYEEDE